MRQLVVFFGAGALACVFGSAAALAAGNPHGSAEPVPIASGFVPFEGAPFIHVLVPGPPPSFFGNNVDPDVITDFNGLTALAYLGGNATDGAGHEYFMQVDVRAYQGTYVSADGTRHRGTFGFV